MRSAGNGGGPPRKSHTKSRKGCRTCKTRHIRCDEAFPQCRNCTKHNVRCDYLDVTNAGEEPPKGSSPPDLLITPQLQEVLDIWRVSGEPPLPQLRRGDPKFWTRFSTTDLRLVHHITTESSNLALRGYGNSVLWTSHMSSIISVALSSRCTMDALLGLSASHLAWKTSNSDTEHLAYQHRSNAAKNLHQALGSFSEKNAEAVLVASVLLSWQAKDWQTWKSLQNSVATLMSAMRPWLQRSELVKYVNSIIPCADQIQPLSPLSRHSSPKQLGSEDVSKLNLVNEAFQTLRLRLVSFPAHMLQHIEDTLRWISLIQTDYPIDDPLRQYERLSSFRSLLFWLPPVLLRPDETDLGALAMTCHFYALAIVLKPLFPDCDGMYLDILVIGPLEKICQMIQTRANASPADTALQTAVAMLDVPIRIAADYRRRTEMKAQPLEPLRSPGIISPYSRNLPSHDDQQAAFSAISQQQYTAYGEPFVYRDYGSVDSGHSSSSERAGSYQRMSNASANMMPHSPNHSSGIDYVGMTVSHTPPTIYSPVPLYRPPLSRQISMPQPIVPSNAAYNIVPPPAAARSYDHRQMQAYLMEYGVK